jgi:predicted outer membrane protein
VLPAVRFVRWAVLGSVLIAIAVSVVLAGGSPSSPQSLSALFGGGTSDTSWGPLGASDRDMLIKVRQANLWEAPVAEQAAQRATSPAVREVGRKIAVEHAQLDGDLRVVADKLNLPLPSQPSDQQKVWMAEISGASPQTYDKTFINIVRAAHGEVMPLVEGVRSGTQNELVRQFAIEAAKFVGRHMEYLESTGLVDYALFPPSTAPAARLTSIGGYNVPITLVLFVIAVLVSAALLRGVGRSRPGTVGRAGAGRWARVAALLGRTRPAARPGGRAAEPSSVTTAELIAVLNPPDPDGEPAPTPARRGARAAVRLSSIPTQRAESLPRVTRLPEPGSPPDPRRSEPSSGKVPARAASRSAASRPAGSRSAESRQPVAVARPERRPPKLGRTSGNRPW